MRVPGGRLTGEIVEWKSRFGWIVPDTAIDHPEAYKHQWRVYANARDVSSGTDLYIGARVSFLPYADGNGIGAEDVNVEEDWSDWDTGRRAKPSKVNSKAGWKSGKGNWNGYQHVGRVQRTLEKPVKGPVKGKIKGSISKGKGKIKGSIKNCIKVDDDEEENGPPAPCPGFGRPNRIKETHEGKGSVISWASTEMQGWRPAMEDAVCTLLELPAPLENMSLFAVFDGHGGSKVSKFVAAKFPTCLASVYQRISEDTDAMHDRPFIERALPQALLELDDMLRADGAGGQGALNSGVGDPMISDVQNTYALMGSTAVVAIIEYTRNELGEGVRPSTITVANCGDSRGIVGRNGMAVALSDDHKPDNPIERARIEGAGGFVAPVGPCERIDGWGLNLSRALGDFHYKAREDLLPEEQKVCAVPDIECHEVTDEDEFLLLCCDGVFELKTSQQAVDHVSASLSAGKPLTQAVEDLVDDCCSPSLVQTAGLGSDNVSAIVVLLR